jgi:hypothetical protein
MSPRTFVTLSSAAVVALVVALGLVVARQVSAEAPAAAGGPMFPLLTENIDRLSRVQVETARYTLDLALSDGKWVATGLGDYPVGEEPFLELISAVAGMTRVEAKTENAEWYHYIGVEGVSPDTGTMRLVAFADDGTRLLDALFGKESTSIGFTQVGGTFVRETEEARSWLVEGVAFAPGFLQEWFEPILSIPGTQVASITILAGDEVLLSADKIDFNTADYELTFLSEAVGPPDATANDAGLRSVTQGIVSTSFDDARPLESVVFGPDSRTLRFTTVTGLELEVRLGEVDGQTWVAYAATAAEGTEAVATAADITARTDRWAFLIPSYRITVLARPIGELIELPPEPPPLAPVAPGLPVAPALPGFNPAAP